MKIKIQVTEILIYQILKSKQIEYTLIKNRAEILFLFFVNLMKL